MQIPSEGFSGDTPRPGPWPARWRKLGRVALWCAAIGAVCAGLALGAGLMVIAHYSEGLPSVDKLKSGYDPPQVTRIVAADQTLLQSVFSERRTVIPFADIPSHTKLAFLAAEDAHFYEHEGLNYWGLLRAVYANLRAGHAVQGGSTITQQVVKNILLDPSRRFSRKLREWILARQLEQSLTKDEILGLYLNHIYLGHGRYGIEEAARYYFNVPASKLDVAQSALLAGLVASPENYSPRRSLAKALVRRKFVLDQMRDKGFVTPDYYKQLLETEVVLGDEPDAQSTLAPEAVEVAKDAIAKARKEHPSQGGFTATTTIHPDLQLAARSAVRKALGEYADRHSLKPPYTQTKMKAWGKPFSGAPHPNKVYVGVVSAADDASGKLDVKVGDITGHVVLAEEPRYNPKHLPPSQFANVGALLRVRLAEPADTEPGPKLRLELGPEAALVAIDVRTRDVVALVGSEEALPGGLDRARRAHRQPGSSFKPIVYAYALRSRLITLGTVLDLEKPGHGLPEPGKGLPEQPPYHLGIRDALAHSNNEASEILLRQATPASVVAFAHELGIESKLGADLSLALGSYEVTPLEMANTYATFASGGFVQPPRLLSELRGPNGENLPLPERPEPRRVLTSEEAYLVTSLLQSVVQRGTGQRALAIGHAVAGKTGTSNESKDTWFIGYSTDLVAAVWVGFDDALPLGKGNQEEGARTALPAFVEFMKAATAGKPRTEFPRPAGIVTATIDPTTGYLPSLTSTSTVEEEFLEGTQPETSAPPETSAAEPRPDMAAKMPYKPQPGELDALPP